MGARVKKTVREQLEEMRTNDSVFEGVNEAEGAKFNRARKRKSTSESQGIRYHFIVANSHLSSVSSVCFELLDLRYKYNRLVGICHKVTEPTVVLSGTIGSFLNPVTDLEKSLNLKSDLQHLYCGIERSDGVRSGIMVAPNT